MNFLKAALVIMSLILQIYNADDEQGFNFSPNRPFAVGGVRSSMTNILYHR